MMLFSQLGLSMPGIVILLPPGSWIWHAGSPLSMVINAVRGMHVLVPRNMTQAAGFYNTYLASDQPVLIIEPLNGYRLREKKPDNLFDFNVPVGVPETLVEGEDARSLIPFDVDHQISKSLQKTNKVLFFDEDVPGGATAHMMQKVIEEQGGFYKLDLDPRTLTAKAHRASYSTDGDYFSNPNAEDVFDAVYNMMHEYNPTKYPKIF